MPYEVKTELCDKCGDCIDACPKNAIAWNTYTWKDEPLNFDDDVCNYCNDCEDVCPNEAIWHWYYR